MEQLTDQEISFDVFFYNPNIHPKEEYEIRKQENIRYCQKTGVKFIDADYDTQNWFSRTEGLEWEPERGYRCTVCFDIRFEGTALFAAENGYPTISSTLGISRWKNMDQINDCGIRAAARYPDVEYWTYNWRKKGGSGRMYELAKGENFYKQEYCGCVYSLRDTNKWRQSQGNSKIKRNENFYSLEE